MIELEKYVKSNLVYLICILIIVGFSLILIKIGFASIEISMLIVSTYIFFIFLLIAGREKTGRQELEKMIKRISELTSAGKFNEALKTAGEARNRKIKIEAIKEINKAYSEVLNRILPFLSSLEDKGMDISVYEDFMEKANQRRYYKGAEKTITEVMRLIKEKEEILGAIAEIKQVENKLNDSM